MILASSGIIASSISGVDADWLAYYNRVITAGGSLTTTEQNATKQLVADLKANSLWTPMKAIYPMVGASAAACAQNLKSSSFTGTFSSGWTFASTGVTPNGSSAYCDTGFNPSLHNSANSSHMSYYSRTLISQAAIDMGCYGTGFTNPNQLAISFGGATSYYNSNCTADTQVRQTTNSQGFFLAARRSATDVLGQRNATQSTGSQAEFRNNVNIVFGAVSAGGTIAYYSTKQTAFASIGDGLTDTQATALYNAVQTMNTTLSRQV